MEPLYIGTGYDWKHGHLGGKCTEKQSLPTFISFEGLKSEVDFKFHY